MPGWVVYIFMLMPLFSLVAQAHRLWLEPRSRSMTKQWSKPPPTIVVWEKPVSMSRPSGLPEVKSIGVPATGRMRPVGQVSLLPSRYRDA